MEGKNLLYQLVDDLRAKAFLSRAESETKKARSEYLRQQEAIKVPASPQPVADSFLFCLLVLIRIVYFLTLIPTEGERARREG